MITENMLRTLYVEKKMSMQDIGSELGFSTHKISYWMNIYSIKRRSISDAVYLKNNPLGDPFKIKPIRTLKDAQLFGLGIGLYWGEGTKADQYAVRIGNSDPNLINTFINFLTKLYDVDKDKLHFGLQLFSDIDSEVALTHWIKKLSVKREQFYKTHITISGSVGTYRKKSKYGVVTLYYHNKRLRDIIVGLLPR